MNRSILQLVPKQNVVKRRFCSAVGTKQTLGHTFEAKVSKFEHRDALIDVDHKRRWTFIELKKWVDAFAFGLVSFYFPPNRAKVVTVLNNDAEIVTTQLAINKLGVSWVPLPSNITNEGLEQALLTHKPRAIVFSTKILSRDRMEVIIPELRYWKQFHNLRSIKYESLRHVIPIERNAEIPGFQPYYLFVTPDHLVKSELPEAVNKTEPTTEAAIVHSDNPVSITHQQILQHTSTLNKQFPLEVGNRVCMLNGFNSVLGGVALWHNILSGAVTVIPSNKFIAEGVAKAIHNEKPVAVVGYADDFETLLSYDQIKRFNLSSIQKALIVGQPPSANLQEKLQQHGIKSVQSFNL